MAISKFEYAFLFGLKDSGLLAGRGALLELGEQHWHGDIPVEHFVRDLRTRGTDDEALQRLAQSAKVAKHTESGTTAHDLVKLLYEAVFGTTDVTSIDLHGTDKAIALDLNESVTLERQFDVVLNIGTGEHVFDVRIFFENIHDLTAPGGLMLHVMPTQGWINHGFYCFQPTFYWDLAARNEYIVEAMFLQVGNQLVRIQDADSVSDVLTKLDRTQQLAFLQGSNAYVLMRKSRRYAELGKPMQGFFTQSRDDYNSSVRKQWGQSTSDQTSSSLKKSS